MAEEQDFKDSKGQPIMQGFYLDSSKRMCYFVDKIPPHDVLDCWNILVNEGTGLSALLVNATTSTQYTPVEDIDVRIHIASLRHTAVVLEGKLPE